MGSAWNIQKLLCFAPIFLACREKITVAADKRYVTLSGTQSSNTIIPWSHRGDIFHSSTLTILGSDFVGRHLTIQAHIRFCRKTFFLGCKITGVGSAFLGRPWASYSRVLFALCYMSRAINPQGWNNWGDITKQSTVYYGEYKCYGPGAHGSGRVSWSRTLSKDEVAPLLTNDFIGGKNWLGPPPTHFKKPSKY